MAEFHLWSRTSLEQFAQESTQKLERQKQEIERLEVDNRALHEAWRKAVAQSVSPDTLTP